VSRTSTGPDGGLQKLSAHARRMKQARDKYTAMKPERKERKKENQAEGQEGNSDLHHKPDGSIVRISKKSNRDVWKRNERT
jgi:hypothetical protein